MSFKTPGNGEGLISLTALARYIDSSSKNGFSGLHSEQGDKFSPVPFYVPMKR